MASGSVMTRIFPFPDSENGKDDMTFEDAVGGRVKTIYGAESVQTAPDERANNCPRWDQRFWISSNEKTPLSSVMGR